MKQFIRTTFLNLLCLVFLASTAHAQLIATDNLGNYPPTGPFDLNGKFVSIGESGGIPGPINGCDFYGFRSQVDSITAINVGMLSLGTVSLPATSFSNFPMLIVQDNATGAGTGGLTGCGKILAAYFDGLTGGTNVVYQVLGSAVATGGTWIPSDLMLKRNVRSIGGALDLVNQLNGVTYQYRTDQFPELGLNSGQQYGFIADEVKTILPEAVQATFTETGELADYDVMNYDMIIPVLTEAIKEQQAIIKTMEERIARLESQKGSSSTLNGSPGINLQQNRPNPFIGVTNISYNIPLNIKNAKLVIYNTNGAVIDIFNITGGQGDLDYDASQLSSGIYFYAIEQNGQSLARKKMVVK
ncbi:MAG: tail fiber domain-containing protein [Bacteroidota bacterium]